MQHVPNRTHRVFLPLLLVRETLTFKTFFVVVAAITSLLWINFLFFSALLFFRIQYFKQPAGSTLPLCVRLLYTDGDERTGNFWAVPSYNFKRKEQLRSSLVCPVLRYHPTSMTLRCASSRRFLESIPFIVIERACLTWQSSP